MATEPQQKEKTRSPLAQRPGPEIAVPDEWRYSIGANGLTRGAYKLRGRGDGAHWAMLAPLPYVTEVIIKRDGQGDPSDHLYRVTMDPASALSVLCSRRDIQRGTWASRLGVPLSLDDRVIKAVGTAILAVATDAPWMEAIPGWSKDSLHMPSAKSAPNGYGVTVGTEEEAREKWPRIIELLSRPGCEKAALYVGAGLGGLYVRRFSRKSAIWHACGKTSGGKTSCITCVSALFGPPERVMRSWGMAPIALTADLLKLGCLTAPRDEFARAARRTPRDVETLVFDITEGGDRVRTNRETGETYTNGSWFGFMPSTGNDSILDLATDNGGLNARVIELKGPLTDSGPTSDKIVLLSQQAAGWPFRWLLDDMTVEKAWAHIAQAERDLGTETMDGLPRRISAVLATAVAGAAILDDLVGTDTLRPSALKAALAALTDLVAEAADLAMEPSEKLLGAIMEAMASEPGSFPTRSLFTDPTEIPEAPMRNIIGVRYSEELPSGIERRIAVFANKLKPLAEAAGIVSPRIGLRDLRDTGVLVPEEHESRKGLTQRVNLGQRHGRVACYVFRQPSDEDQPTPPKVGPSPATLDEDLAPMPPAPFSLRPDGTPTDIIPPTPATASTASTASTAPTETTAPVAAEAVPPATATAPPAPDTAPPTGSVPPARAPHTARPKPTRTDVRAVTSGGLFDPATGAFTPIPEPATTSLPELVALVADETGGRHTTLVFDTDVQARYGLLGDRPRHTKPWHEAFGPLVEAGWHQPRKPGQRPRVQPTTSIEHPERNGHIRLTVAGWLKPSEFPMGPKGDTATAAELALRLSRYAELTGWAFTGTAANTAVWALRGLLEQTSKTFIKWVPDSSAWPTWAAADSWSRVLTDQERAMGFLAGYDAVKNYLPAYSQAIVAGAELVHVKDPVFDEKQAGLWLIRVPEWPHPLVPAPVHEVEPGKYVWVTTAVVKLYVETGINPEIAEAWIADAVGFEGFRAFTGQLRDALKAVEASPADADEVAVRDALKATYRTLHGKLRNDDQWVLRRPDWGYAVRDAAWTGILRKVYRSAGVLGTVETPRYPAAVDTDEVVYPTADPDPRAAVPAGLKLATEGELPGLGQFRPKTAMTTKEWEETRG
ncbi:DUF927 domain-containing protein [Streptomyces sp. NPDC048659]|uniref:DUF927 domain-containing protein n=1 Tax=Streptomyces sp. NPDC048659 TaxID=3155489 RepID=UPI00342679F7